MPDREWPGLDPDGEHGAAWEKDYTGDPFRYCWSCGGTHHPRNKSCNGLRSDEHRRCQAILGEARCNRPLHHLGEHVADSDLMRVEWRVKSGPSATRDDEDLVSGYLGPAGTAESETS